MKKKILILTIFILILSFSSVFASTVSKENIDKIMIEFNCNEAIEVNSFYNAMLNDLANPNYYKLIKASNKSIHVFIAEEMPYMRDTLNDILIYHLYYYNIGDTFLNKVDNFSNSTTSVSTSNYIYVPDGVLTVDKSDYYYNKNYENQAILNIEETPDTGDISGDFQGTLPEIVAETNPERVLAEIVGLLPIVMVCLVSLVGLRKALQLLSDLLRQS